MAEDPQAGRYREAADRLLEQLDLVIDYLYRIRKDKLADGLARNCDAIRRRLRDPPPTPRP
jgi:hypothetical protein